MDYHELYRYTKTMLKGKPAFTASLLYVSLCLLLKLIPCFLAAALCIFGMLHPAELLTGAVPAWAVFSVLWELLSFCVRLPVYCALCSWFTDAVGMRRNSRVRLFFPDASGFCKAILFFGGISLIRAAALAPFFGFCTAAVVCFERSIALPESGMWLFAFIQSLCAAFWSLLFYGYLRLGTLAAPFLYLENPDISLFHGFRDSMLVMKGIRWGWFRILLHYAPSALPVVTIPLFLPNLIGSFTLLVQIRMMETEQIRKEQTHYAKAAIYHGAADPVQT